MPSIAIDARALQKRPYTGVGHYLKHLLEGWHDAGVSKTMRLYFNQYRSLPTAVSPLGYQHRQFHIPSKLLTLSFMLFKRPDVGRFISESVLFMPNMHHLALRDDRPLVLVVHDVSFIHFPRYFTWKQRLWHRILRFRHLVKRANRIITDSKVTARDLVSLFPDIEGDRIVTIPLGVNTGYFNTADSGAPELSYPYVLYISTFEPRKNVLSIIAAFNLIAQKNPDLHLVLAGDAGWRSRAVFSAIGSSSAVKRIKYLGYVGENEKRELYRNARVFVYPSLYEGFGLPPLEAMAMGCPVVASSAGSLPEVLGSAALLVSPFHTHELALAIEAVLTDEKLAFRMRGDGRAHAREFTWTKTALKTYDVLKEMLL